MLYSDPVTFYANVCCYRTIEYVQTSTWVLLEPAELLFTYSGTLVFSGNRGTKSNLSLVTLVSSFYRIEPTILSKMEPIIRNTESGSSCRNQKI